MAYNRPFVCIAKLWYTTKTFEKILPMLINFQPRGFIMEILTIVLLTVLGCIVLGALWFMGSYNGLVRLKALVDEAWSGIDVQLKRRYDLIPNVVAVVKQYSIHEQSVLENVTRMRSVSMHATTVAEKAQAEAGLAGALKTLFAVAENYPNLKANEQFTSLQNTLSKLEDEIQLAHRYYNGTVREYMTKRSTFPTVMVAGLCNFCPVSYFEMPAEHRENPRVTF